MDAGAGRFFPGGGGYFLCGAQMGAGGGLRAADGLYLHPSDVYAHHQRAVVPAGIRYSPHRGQERKRRAVLIGAVAVLRVAGAPARDRGAAVLLPVAKRIPGPVLRRHQRVRLGADGHHHPAVRADLPIRDEAPPGGNDPANDGDGPPAQPGHSIHVFGNDGRPA